MKTAQRAEGGEKIKEKKSSGVSSIRKWVDFSRTGGTDIEPTGDRADGQEQREKKGQDF